jgi:hypothetical protein
MLKYLAGWDRDLSLLGSESLVKSLLERRLNWWILLTFTGLIE